MAEKPLKYPSAETSREIYEFQARKQQDQQDTDRTLAKAKMKRQVPARISAERSSVWDNPNLAKDIEWQTANAKYNERARSIEADRDKKRSLSGSRNTRGKR